MPTTELVPVPHDPAGPHLPAARTTDVLEAWLSARNPNTLRGYRRDLAIFAEWLGAPSPEAAVEVFLSSGQAHANRIALAWRASLVERGLATATVCRRLAALRSLVKVARLIGRVSWSLDVEGPRVEPRRDMRGPDAVGVRLTWLAAAARGDGPRARRDRCMLALLFDLGLRRAELCAIDLADVEPGPAGPAAVWVRGKGRAEKERLTLPGPTAAAVAGWLQARGDRPGPLVHRLDGPEPGRLSGECVRLIVRRLGDAAGLGRPLRPHGLRHAAATSALDAGRDVRSVRKFTRHRSLEMVLRYDDQRRDVAGEIARDLAARRDDGGSPGPGAEAPHLSPHQFLGNNA
ncbi:MAG TPA: tyrosine-type recombinase/integrase [Isosphaeraceae bacterium]|nr:tyrosine-type recombinase/integrase [Isosphaeraceae bacterium]